MTTKVVPREPTQEMTDAAYETLRATFSLTGDAFRTKVKRAISAALDAAPAVEGERQEMSNRLRKEASRHIGRSTPDDRYIDVNQMMLAAAELLAASPAGERQEPVADEARAHLRYLLPMAKAWAHAHPVGRNESFVADAIAYLEQFAAASPVEPSAPPEPIAYCTRSPAYCSYPSCACEPAADGIGPAQCEAQERPAQDDDAALIARLIEDGEHHDWLPPHVVRDVRAAAARLAALQAQVTELTEQLAERGGEVVWADRARQAWEDKARAAEDRVRDQQGEIEQARKLLLRWLQAYNKMDKDAGMTIAEFNALRQESHAAIAAAKRE